MAWKKAEQIAHHYKLPSFEIFLKEMYLKQQLSTDEIAKRILKDTNVTITPRSLQRWTQKLNLSRSKSDARKIGILKGRVDYTPLRKPVKSKELRKGISLKLRYEILTRDNFKCVLCGTDAKNSILVVDHVVPVVQGGTNDISNLRILCQACNQGKKIYEKEK